MNVNSEKIDLSKIMLGKKPNNNIIGKESKSFMLKNNSYLIKTINDKNCDDYMSFSYESALLYSESVMFGNFATETLLFLNKDNSFIKNISKKYALESVKDIIYSTESNKTSVVKRRGILKRVWSAIITAFQKLIGSVSNFVRSILNFIKSSSFKKINKFYEDNKSILLKDLNYKRKELKFKTPKKNINVIIQSLNTSISSMCLVSNNFDKKIKEFEKMINDLNNNNVYDGKNLLYKLKGYSKPNEIIENMLKSVIDSISFNDKNVKEFISNNSTIKLQSPSEIVNILFYDKKTSNSSDLSNFIKMVPFTILSKKTSDDMKTFVENGKKSIKSLNSSLIIIRSIAKKAEETAVKQIKKGNNSINQRSLNILTEFGNISRKINTFTVGIILNVYKEFMRIQSYSYSVAKHIVKEYKIINKGGKK